MAQVEVTKVVARHFTCASCGARGEVTFEARGTGAAEQTTASHGRASLGAGEAVQADLALDEARMFGLVACPTCGKRATNVVLGIAVRAAALLVLAAGLPFVLGVVRGSVGAIACVAVAGYYGWLDYRRLVRARAIVVTKVKPGPSATPGSRGRAR